jgi:hypothetical protein
MAGLFSGGGFIKYFLKTTKRLGKEGRKNFREGWRDVHSNRPGQPYTPPILEDDMDLHTLGLSNEDMQTVESEGITAIEMCQFFGVPPHLVFILNRATFSNIEHQGIEYKSLHLQPWAVRFEQAIESHFDEADPFYVEFLMDALLRGDTKTRYEAYSKALGGRAFATVNEVRRKEGWEPIDGEDELPPMPNESLPREEEEEPEEAETPEPPEQEDETQAAAVNLQPLVLDAGRRIVAREVSGLRARADKAADDRATWDKWAATWYGGHSKYIAATVRPILEAAGIGNGAADRFADTYCVAQMNALAGQPVAETVDEWEHNQPAAVAERIGELLECSTS